MRSLIVVFCLLVGATHGLKFLMYNSKTSPSHVGFVNNVGSALIDAGHEVVMYMPNLDENFGNASNHKKARIIERQCDFLEVAKTNHIGNFKSAAWTQDSSITGRIKSHAHLGNFFKVSCDHQLRDEKLMQQLRDEKFDLGFSESFDPCGFGIFEKIGLKKHILLYSSILPSGHAAHYGIPSTPSFVTEYQQKSAAPLSYVDRFRNQLAYSIGSTLDDKVFLERVAESFEPNNVSGNIKDMMSRSSFFFVNTDELVDFPRPISHKIVNIAGVGIKKALAKRGSLEKKYQEIFDKSKRGVIYISFGSVANSAYMPDRLKKAFIEAFRAFPDVTFLWKYEKPEDEIVQNIPNLVTGKWLPQREIFGQEKLLAFVSHGGMNSIVEASTSGVPTIGIPLFSDQYRNSLMVETKGTGITLDKSTMTKDTLIGAFHKIIENPSYKQNARTLAKMIAAKPMSPDERIVKYAEFAANFDTHEALDMSGRHLSVFTFYNLDVLAAMAAIVALTIFVLYKLVSFVLKFALSRVFAKTKRD